MKAKDHDCASRVERVQRVDKYGQNHSLVCSTCGKALTTWHTSPENAQVALRQNIADNFSNYKGLSPLTYRS